MSSKRKRKTNQNENIPHLKKIRLINNLINEEEYHLATEKAMELYNNFSKKIIKRDEEYRTICAVSALLTDLASFTESREIAELATNIYNEHTAQMLKIMGASKFHYNYANSLVNLLETKDSFRMDYNTIEDFIQIKKHQWISLKTDHGEKNQLYYQKITNLAITLKRQMRLPEALSFFKEVMDSQFEIPEAYIGYAESLHYLRQLSGQKSIKMLAKIKSAFLAANNMPVRAYLKNYCLNLISYYEGWIDSLESEFPFPLVDMSEIQFENLDEYQKFCITNNLILSEHGLFCGCIAASKDDLTFETEFTKINHHLINEMKERLNEIIRNYNEARISYYKYIEKPYELEEFLSVIPDISKQHRHEILINPVKSCLSALDKIASAICLFFDIPLKKDPKNGDPQGKAYFQNFWRLDLDNRREMFNTQYRNPGLLSLYSIASDINNHKEGELKHLKDWRNAIEHDSFRITRTKSEAIEANKILSPKGCAVEIDKFMPSFKILMQLTRSAIFSFTYAIRQTELKTEIDDFYTFPSIQE